MRFKINWANLIVRSKFTIFALFYFVFEDNFPSTNPWGAYIWRGDLTEGFLRYEFGGLVFGGAYFWGECGQGARILCLRLSPCRAFGHAKRPRGQDI